MENITVKRNPREGEGVIMVVSGPAGSGKGTVVNSLMGLAPDELELSVSATTRSPRPGEVEGKSYYFITREDFESRIQNGQMLEYNYYCENYYGTPADAAKRVIASGKSLILEIDINGGLQVKKSYPDVVLVMLLPPDFDTLEQRLRGRGTETEEVICARLKRACQEVAMIDQYDYVVYNETGRTEDCARDLLSIIHAERRRVKRNPSVEANFFTPCRECCED